MAAFHTALTHIKQHFNSRSKFRFALTNVSSDYLQTFQTPLLLSQILFEGQNDRLGANSSAGEQGSHTSTDITIMFVDNMNVIARGYENLWLSTYHISKTNYKVQKPITVTEMYVCSHVKAKISNLFKLCKKRFNAVLSSEVITKSVFLWCRKYWNLHYCCFCTL